MTETIQAQKRKRDRSPSFPFISLKVAIRRLAAFEDYFKRHPAPAKKAGLAWGMKGDSSQAGQTIAALKAFGLIEYSGSGASLQASVTEEGRNVLRAKQESIKRSILTQAALRPKVIAKYWQMWNADRPPDPICLNELVLRGAFTDAAAKLFLGVYDDTIAYAGLSDSDKAAEEDQEANEAAMPAVGRTSQDDNVPTERRRHVSDIAIAEPQFHSTHRREILGERELTTGLLSKEASFRLLVSGPVGKKEIERLIKKLELDKEILADSDADDNDGGNA